VGRTVTDIPSNYLPFVSSSMQYSFVRIAPRCLRSAVRALRTCDWGPAVVGWRFPPNSHHIRLGIGRSGDEMRLARWPRWHCNMRIDMLSVWTFGQTNKTVGPHAQQCPLDLQRSGRRSVRPSVQFRPNY
jgi:hypothetical protein